MASRYLLAIDQGTTGSTALVVSHDARVLGRVNREFPQHYPKPAWVEHEPDEIWASVQAAVNTANRWRQGLKAECPAVVIGGRDACGRRPIATGRLPDGGG